MPKLTNLINDAILVRPGEASKLAQRSTNADDLFPDREAAEAETEENAKTIDGLQDALWAERSRALLVILQGMDTSGKDGTVRGVFNRCGPLGVNVTAFGKPSEQELAHDFLWRIHLAAPKKGMIGVFNRSQYEDVLVVKVRKLAPPDVVERRYEQINAFERHLTENGVTVLKFMLNISKEEQKERLQSRLDEPTKHWKFKTSDLDARAQWDEWDAAFTEMLSRTSTDHAPWYIIPADKKWYRDWAVATIMVEVLESMDLTWPGPAADLTGVVIT